MIAKDTINAIITGVVNAYLIADSGVNSGKWWSSSSSSWSSTEASAGVCSYVYDNNWQVSISSAAWDIGVKYTTYATESGELHIPYSEQVIECDYQTLPSETASDYHMTGFLTPGGEINLADDAITASVHDQTTAWPLETADIGV